MDPVELGKILVPLAALAGIYLKLQTAIRQIAGKGDAREITNNPLNVLAQSRPATMEDINHVALRVLTLERRFESHMSEMQTTTAAIEDSVLDCSSHQRLQLFVRFRFELRHTRPLGWGHNTTGAVAAQP